ncbi:MAG: META domain-containing protein [Rhodobacteraceae bacterium]|nr:MAG: META domain-containing protein [Paracoccaceae bacterium]
MTRLLDGGATLAPRAQGAIRACFRRGPRPYSAGRRRRPVMRRAVAAALAALLSPPLALFAAPAGAEAVVEGEAYYLERIALPPGAVFEATLQDVARADAPADILGRHVVEDAGAPPYRFAIPYDPAALTDRGRYAVRATITVEDRLWFTTDSHHEAFGDAPLSLRMVRVAAAEETAAAPLVGPRWRLVAMGEAPVETEGQREPPHLEFADDGGVFGSGGCNRLRGGYELGEGGQISFGPAASTMMACDDDTMMRERGFFGVMEIAERYVIEGDRLTLIANDAPVAAFVAE